MAEQQLNLLATSEFPAISLASQRDFHMMASIKAPVIQADIRDRAPIDLVAVIDKSGSMSGDKIDLVKKTCNFILKQLTSSDRFSVVSYDTNVQIEFGLTNMTPAHKKTSATKINNIHVGSSTNLSGGLLTGLDLLINDNNSTKSPVSSVFLLTDGQANAGITSGKELAKVVQERLKKMSNPCSIFTFGFGADHDESFLTQISDQGSGMYYFVKDEEAISTAFADALGGLLSVVAQNIQMTITPVNGVRIQKTLGVIAPPKKNKNKEEDNAPEDNDEENEDTDMADDEKTVLDQEDQQSKKTRGNKSKKATIKKEAKPVVEEVVGSTDPVTVDIGDLYSEEGRDVVLKLYVPATENPSDTFELAKVKLTYFNPRSNNATCETSISCTVQRKNEVSAEEQVRDVQVDKQINRLLAAECMEAAKTEASNGNLEKARQMLNDTINVINASVSSKDALCQDLVADLQQILGSLKSEQTWNNVGAKEVAWIASAHKRQRGAGKGGKAYQNEAKKNMVKKAQDYNDEDDEDEDDQDDYNDEEANFTDAYNDVDMPSTNLKRKYDQISNTRGKGGKGLGTGKMVPQQQQPMQMVPQQQQPVQMVKPAGGKGLGKGAPVAQLQQQKAPSLKKSTKHISKKGKWSAPQSF